jgi:two-component system, OmpR family, response regulator ChvI
MSKLCKYIQSLQSNKNRIKKHPYRILLVDDEPDITLTFSIVLEDNGYVVDTFNDPLLALSSFNKKHGLYALAVIDIKMPKMTGIEFYQQMKEIDKKVKVCFMTAFDINKEDIKAAIPTLKEEKPTIFRKPIKLEDLVAGVKAELEN